MLIFVSSQYRGDVEKNTEKAKEYCKYILDQGHTPFAPHLLYPQLLNDNDHDERARGLLCGIDILLRCNEVWVFGDKITEGMQFEIDYAELYGIPVMYK